MAPQTRSRGTVAAPSSRVYHSTPSSYQVRFPSRRREVKTYNNRRHSARSLRQQTLTQINYLRPADLEIEDDTEDEVEDVEESSRPQKRRKTMGDLPDATPRSTFHTQTLTQFLGVKNEDEDEEDDDEGGGSLLLVKDSEDEDEDDLDLNGLQKENMAPRKPGKGTRMVYSPPVKVEEEKSSQASVIPQTPLHKRLVGEIPSSQPSPFTPMLEKYSTISPHRSPLKDRSTNTEAPAPTVVKITSVKPRRLVIEDTFSTVGESVMSSRTVLSDLNSADATRRIQGKVHDEIPDSDDEFVGLDASSEGPGTPELPHGQLNDKSTPPLPRQSPNIREDHLALVEVTPTLPSTGYVQSEQDPVPPARNSTPDIIAEDEEDLDSAPVSPSPNRGHKIIFQSSDPVAEKEKETPLSSPHHTSPIRCTYPRPTQPKSQVEPQWIESQRVPLEVIRTLGPQNARSDIILSIHPEDVDKIIAGTKNHEFRDYRISLTVVRMWIYVTSPVCELRYMATVSQAKQPGDIVDERGLGNAGFNRGTGTKFAYELLQVYQLNNPVPLALMLEYGWVQGPPQKYVFVPPAVIGELLGNLRCEVLPEPHEEVQEETRDNDHVSRGGGSSDGGWGNFHRQIGASSGDMSVSQEVVEKQLRSDFEHYTQLPSDIGDIDTVPSGQGNARIRKPRARPPSSTCLEEEADERVFAKPALPPFRAAEFSSGQRQSRLHDGRPPAAAAGDDKLVGLSQATTASEPSTPVTSPDKSVPRPQPCSSVPSLPEYIDDSPIQLPSGVEGMGTFSLGSSQMMVHDSLVADVRPPPVAWDSEDEE